MFRKISGDFSANTMKKNPGLNGCAHNFTVDYETFNISDTISSHKHSMKKRNIK